MAAKGSAPRVRNSVVLPLDDFSIAADSGWRDLDEDRIDELVSIFKNGDFGATTLAMPTVLCDDEGKALLSREDGRARINNGKSTVAALQKLRAEWLASGPRGVAGSPGSSQVAGNDPAAIGGADPIASEDVHEWATARMLDVLTTGLRVDYLVYPEPDDALVIAINALQHDSEQNKYVPTSLVTKVNIVLTQRSRVQGGDWQSTVQALLQIYGVGKRRTVLRWVSVAKDMGPEILEHFKLKRLQVLPHGFIFDNKYFIGQGEAARYKLGQAYALSVLDMASDKFACGQAITVAQFCNEYCAVLKAVETLEKRTMKDFGKAAETFPAWQRVLRMLRSEPGRQRVLSCLRDKVPLAGTPGKSDAGGIEEVRIVIEELSKMKAGSDASGKNSGGGQTPQGDGGETPQNGGGETLQTQPQACERGAEEA